MAGRRLCDQGGWRKDGEVRPNAGVLTGRETLVEALSWRLIYPSESRFSKAVSAEAVHSTRKRSQSRDADGGVYNVPA